MMTKRWIGTKAWLVTADEFFFNLLWCLRCRWWTGSFVWRHPQFSFQAWSSFRPSLDLFGQARLGAVFLQGGPPRRDGANPQKSASLHHHESHRSQFGATDPCGKIFLYSFLQGQVKMIFQHHNSAFFSTLFKEEVILQSWPTARSFTFKNIFRSTTTKFSSFPHPSLCDFYLHSILENILANPKIGFNPYNFTKILGDFTYLKWCKALASSIWFCLQKLLCWCPKKSFLRQESAYGRKSHHATTIYGGAIQIQVNKGTRKRTNPFPGGDEEKKSWGRRQKMPTLLRVRFLFFYLTYEALF